jgi:hypothetical protein
LQQWELILQNRRRPIITDQAHSGDDSALRANGMELPFGGIRPAGAVTCGFAHLEDHSGNSIVAWRELAFPRNAREYLGRRLAFDHHGIAVEYLGELAGRNAGDLILR